jgi:biotin synthase
VGNAHTGQQGVEIYGRVLSQALHQDLPRLFAPHNMQVCAGNMRSNFKQMSIYMSFKIDKLSPLLEDALNFVTQADYSTMQTQTVKLYRPAQEPKATSAERWSVAEIEALFKLPFNDLMFRAQQVHRENFDANAVQLSTLLSIKTGGCSEDCGYCPQSAFHSTGVENRKMLDVAEVVKAAQAAKDSGAGRFCMGAAWREPSEEDMQSVLEMVKAVRGLGMETCATLGMLKDEHVAQLSAAGLDYYNHNLDTSPDFYGDIISTRDYQDRLDTLERVRKAGMHVCSGGIVGMGENVTQRAGLLAQLANMEPYPESVPINNLVKVEGTPLQDAEDIDPLDFVRMIAVARITMPTTRVRLSAGRQQMSEVVQAMCFLAGANSMFYGDQLLTTGNPDVARDRAMLDKLGMYPQTENH